MANTQLAVLTDAELDLVAAGQSGGNQQTGLVNAADVLNNNRVRILNDSVNNNDLAVSVAVLSVGTNANAGD